jgi:hypothetical protein
MFDGLTALKFLTNQHVFTDLVGSPLNSNLHKNDSLRSRFGTNDASFSRKHCWWASFSLQKYYLKQDKKVRNIIKICETTQAQACLYFATKNRRNTIFFNKELYHEFALFPFECFRIQYALWGCYFVDNIQCFELHEWIAKE